MLSTTLIFAPGASACDISRTDSTHIHVEHELRRGCSRMSKLHAHKNKSKQAGCGSAAPGCREVYSRSTSQIAWALSRPPASLYASSTSSRVQLHCSRSLTVNCICRTAIRFCYADRTQYRFQRDDSSWQAWTCRTCSGRSQTSELVMTGLQGINTS